MTKTIRDLSDWPSREEDVTVDAIIRCVGVDAQRTWLQKWETIKRKDKDGRDLYVAQVEVCLGAVGLIGALRALRESDPVAALNYARQYWVMCEDGEQIGEMLWQWLEAAGVDPALVEQALATDAVDPVVTK